VTSSSISSKCWRSSTMRFFSEEAMPSIATAAAAVEGVTEKRIKVLGGTEGGKGAMTGAFKKQLPDVYPPSTHFRRALRGLKEIKADHSIKNLRNQNRKLTAQTMDMLMKCLTIPITETLSAYQKTFRNLHPFEATVADLVVISRVKVGHRDLNSLLADLKVLRAATSRIAKDYASRASVAASAVEAKELLENGMKELEDLYASPSGASLEELVDLQKELRKIPVIELDTPSVVLVGAPNVGKSSIVRAVSSGTPEVNDYPFTTRGVTVGHIVDPQRSLRFQVMDTPGLLDRAADERNEMERLTFASLAHLPTAVIFVIDPSGMSGEKSTLAAQLNVRAMLKERFPRRPWLDVVSKGDLSIPDSVILQMPPNYMPVSVHSGLNVELLKEEIERMLLIDLKKLLASREAQQAQTQQEIVVEEEEEQK